MRNYKLIEIIAARKGVNYIPFRCGIVLECNSKKYALDEFGLEQLQKSGVKLGGTPRNMIDGESVFTGDDYRTNESAMCAYANQNELVFVKRSEVASFIKNIILKQEGNSMKKFYVVANNNGVLDLLDSETNTLERKQIVAVAEAVAKKEIDVVNVGFKRGAKGIELTGKTGTAAKINKGERVAVCTSAFEDGHGKKLGYRFVDCRGTVLDVNMQSVAAFMKSFGEMVQNATIVDGKYIRGISWEIPVVIEKVPDAKAKPDVAIGLDLSFQPVVMFNNDASDKFGVEVALVEVVLSIAKHGTPSVIDKVTGEKLLKAVGSNGFDGKIVPIKKGTDTVGIKFCAGPEGNEGLVSLVTRAVKAGAKVEPVTKVRSNEWPIFSLNEEVELESSHIEVKTSDAKAVALVQKTAVNEANSAIKEGQLYAIGTVAVPGSSAIAFDGATSTLKVKRA